MKKNVAKAWATIAEEDRDSLVETVLNLYIKNLSRHSKNAPDRDLVGKIKARQQQRLLNKWLSLLDHASDRHETTNQSQMMSDTSPLPSATKNAARPKVATANSTTPKHGEVAIS